MKLHTAYRIKSGPQDLYYDTIMPQPFLVYTSQYLPGCASHRHCQKLRFLLLGPAIDLCTPVKVLDVCIPIFCSIEFFWLHQGSGAAITISGQLQVHMASISWVASCLDESSFSRAIVDLKSGSIWVWCCSWSITVSLTKVASWSYITMISVINWSFQISIPGYRSI